MDRTRSLAVFVRVADLGSFAAAARDLGLSPAMVGNHVRSLETWFNAPLLARTTRQQSLTDTGRFVLEKARAVLSELAELEDIAGTSGDFSGPLRVSAPLAIGREIVAPALQAFVAAHPSVEAELRLSDQVEDLVRSGLDLAVRNGPMRGGEASLVARVVARQVLVLAAAPAYLDRAGMPESLAELDGHRTVRYARNGRGRALRFAQGSEEIQLDPPVAFMADDVFVLRDATRAGLGVTQLPLWLLAPCFRDGSLQPVLPAHTFEIDTFVVKLANARSSPKTVALGEHLAQQIAAALATIEQG